MQLRDLQVPDPGEATLCFRPCSPSHEFLSGATRQRSAPDSHMAGRGHSGGLKGTGENTSFGGFEERKQTKKQTRKPELQLVWACFIVGLGGQEKTRTSLKSFSTTDVAATTEEKAVGWVCWKYNSRRRGGLWVWADTSPYQSGHVSVSLGAGALLLPQGTGNLGRGPRECKHLHPEWGGRTPTTSRLPGRAEKRRNTLQQKPPDVAK